MSFALVPLVDKPELIDQCIDLLNEEWPRSREWRRIGLERLLGHSPPMAYVLIDIASDTLVGHARLCPLDLESSGCWVESVVVRNGMRGRGTGQKLMAMVEAEARRHGFNKVYSSEQLKLHDNITMIDLPFNDGPNQLLPPLFLPRI
ncbi:hypothetical protein GPALN_011092 [Globodera pallida]|nr:hypothetical protein GPALN_011092 [Globodera pallida]